VICHVIGHMEVEGAICHAVEGRHDCAVAGVEVTALDVFWILGMKRSMSCRHAPEVGGESWCSTRSHHAIGLLGMGEGSRPWWTAWLSPR
jgi:hypothetical protein